MPRDGVGVCGGFGRDIVWEVDVRELVGKSSSLHIEAKRAADACMLALGGRTSSLSSSSSKITLCSSSSYCARAAACSFARRFDLIPGGSKMG